MSKTMDALKKPLPKKEAHIFVQEEIAKTYFKTSDRGSSRKKIISKIPWLVTFIALSLVFAVLVSRSNIDIKIRILSEVPAIKRDIKKGPLDDLRDKGIFLVRGAEVNNNLIKKTSFMGDAKTFGRVTEDQVVLRNSKGSGWANYTIELKEPVDLNKFDIRYTARGTRGN